MRRNNHILMILIKVLCPTRFSYDYQWTNYYPTGYWNDTHYNSYWHDDHPYFRHAFENIWKVSRDRNIDFDHAQSAYFTI